MSLIFGLNISSFSAKSIQKAAVEGVYADTYVNRKLGRVGMTYAAYEEKINGPKKDIDTITANKLYNILIKEFNIDLGVRDKGDYFQLSFSKEDFSKGKIEKVKEFLEKRGAKVFIYEQTHSMKAYKKDVQEGEETQDLFKIGKFEFDPIGQIISSEGEEDIVLTSRESELLESLALSSNKVVSRDFILEKIWGESNYYNARSMDVYITKLRHYLGENGVQIINVHGQGFKLVLPKSQREEDKAAVASNAKGKESESKEPKKRVTKSEPITAEKGDKYAGAKSAYQEKVFKKINEYFGFEDEEGDWFMDTPMAVILQNDSEFTELIDKFTDYEVAFQSGKFESNGDRKNILGCSVSFDVVPKGVSDEEYENSQKPIYIDHKTTIRDVLIKLGISTTIK